MIVVKKVESKQEQKAFIQFPIDLYNDVPYFVPALYSDEKKLFSKNYVYYEQSEAVYFNAYDNGRMVGRISAILQHAANHKWQQKRVRFTRFDAVDCQEVADALFKAVEDYALAKGMDTVCGPLGFSDLEREGLLIEGFDEYATFEEQYNFPYYQRLIENCGYEKEVDWLERKVYAPDVIDDRLKNISNRMLEKYHLKLAEAKSMRSFLKRYGDQFFNILDITYADLYQTVPLTEKTKKMLMDSFSLIVNVNNVSVIVDENDRVVCFGLMIPSIGKVITESKGRLTLKALIKILKIKKNPRILDFALIGVLPEYQSKGIATALICRVMDLLQNPQIEYAETNLNLEDNYAIQNQWKVFKTVQHKRRRSFVKALNNNL